MEFLWVWASGVLFGVVMVSRWRAHKPPSCHIVNRYVLVEYTTPKAYWNAERFRKVQVN